MQKPRLIVFASGTKDGGGSGFENLVTAARKGELVADIVAVVSNHEHGGVRKRAESLSIPFEYFEPTIDARRYTDIVRTYEGEWCALSGWLRKADDLDPAKTFNIHPALLSIAGGKFGGPGLYGSHVLEAVYRSLQAGECDEFGITMHFVTSEYDRGPAFFEFRIKFTPDMTKEFVASVVQKTEHAWQPKITDMVIHGEIEWDGKDPSTLKVPFGYPFLPRS